MKAFIMAAGKGERLGKLTEETPKCLLPVGGVPMLERWIRSFAKWGFSGVFVNTSYKMADIVAFLRYRGMGIPWNIVIDISKEGTPLGTAQTLWVNRSFVENEKCFAVVYCDVWTDFDIRKIIESHVKPVTLGLQYVPNPVDKGIALTVGDTVIDFEEKPKKPVEGLPIWTGILIASPEIFNMMDGTEKDIGSDLLPKLAKKGVVGAYCVEDVLFDIGGSIEKYEEIKNF